MSYFNYHGNAKKLIKEGHLVEWRITDKYNAISPALVLIFDNHRPIPVREYRWSEYIGVLPAKIEIKLLQ